MKKRDYLYIALVVLAVLAVWNYGPAAVSWTWQHTAVPTARWIAETNAPTSVAPAETAHVGDDVTTDVAGARGVGMRAIHLCHSTSVSQHSDGAESIPSLHALLGILFSIR